MRLSDLSMAKNRLPFSESSIKRLLLRFTIFFLTGALQGAFAQIPSLKTEYKDEKIAKDQLPDPLALAPNWWRYLEVDPEVRGQKTKRVIARIRERFEQLPTEAKLKAEPVVKRAIDNLNAFSDSSSSKPSQVSSRPPFAESYSLIEWLEITRKLRYTQGEIESDRDSIQREEMRIESMRHDFDTMSASYYHLPENSNKKALTGFDLIADWTSIAILESRQKANKQNLAALTEHAKHLAEEAKIAGSRITTDKNTIQQLDNEIDKVAARLMRSAANSHRSNQFVISEAKIRRWPRRKTNCRSKRLSISLFAKDYRN